MNSKRVGVCLAVLVLPVTAVMLAQMPGHGRVEMQGMKAAMKFETSLDGYLAPLNGRFKLRATEVEIEPGGSVGEHLHAGPGIRAVIAGELTFVEETGKEYRIPAGEYFYEGGDISLKVFNRGAQPAKMIVVEVLAGDWAGSAMMPLSRRAELDQLGAKLRKQVCEGN